MTGKRRKIEIIAPEYLESFHKELSSCVGNPEAILRCTRKHVDKFMRFSGAVISTMIREAAERLEMSGIEPHIICARLTKVLGGRVSSRTVRYALPDKYKNPVKARNARMQVRRKHLESGLRDTSFAAPVPQITHVQIEFGRSADRGPYLISGELILAPTLAVGIDVHRHRIFQAHLNPVVISGTATVTSISSAVTSSILPPSSDRSCVEGTVAPTALPTYAGSTATLSKSLGPVVARTLAASQSGCTLYITSGTVVGAEPDLFSHDAYRSGKIVK